MSIFYFKVTFSVTKSANFNCVTVPKIDEDDSSKKEKSENDNSVSPFHLPVKILPKVRDDGRLFVRSSKTIFFNRIAKTGSQVNLGESGFLVFIWV